MRLAYLNYYQVSKALFEPTNWKLEATNAATDYYLVRSIVLNIMFSSENIEAFILRPDNIKIGGHSE